MEEWERSAWERRCGMGFGEKEECSFVEQSRMRFKAHGERQR